RSRTRSDGCTRCWHDTQGSDPSVSGRVRRRVLVVALLDLWLALALVLDVGVELLGVVVEHVRVVRGVGGLGVAERGLAVVDAREEFATGYVVPAIKANAIYGLGYPLFTALGRPLIAKLAVEYARKHNCDTIAHGCTGKGNDQVRIEATVATLAPELKVIAP